MLNKNLLIVLSGPSGVGKGTVVKKLLSSENFALSVSCTTRGKREGEIDGEAYFFITKEKFLENIQNNGFLEYSEHFGNYYGTPRKFVEEQLKSRDVILEIEVDGALQAKKSYPEAVLIMLLPPDEETLKSRLRGRGTESEEDIQRRLKRAEYELSQKDKYDFCVVNDDLQECVNRIENLIKELKGV